MDYDILLGTMPVEELTIQTLRTLAMDAVQKAESGHPGTPMALAPAAYVLWRRFLRFNPKNPHWFNRDRFVLSNGHASMLLYGLLHLSGYGLSLDEIENFRQWGSRTPGHPEYGLTPGVETTTGPLGQGLMNAVGMALAEAHLAARYNQDGFPIVDHRTYVFCSDGDMMEGASHEAASLAGHLGLGKLICLYDDNHITIDGDTALTFGDDTAQRFEAYHWQVQNLGEAADDLDALSAAFKRAREERQRPSLIIVRSHIAEGAPNAHDTAAAHGSPLGEDEVMRAKETYGWPQDAHFLVPARAIEHMRQAGEEGAQAEHRWKEICSAYRIAHPRLAADLESALSQALAPGWDEDLPMFDKDAGPVATRAAAGNVLNSLAKKIPWLIGGAGDLASSTKAWIESSAGIGKDRYGHRNIHYGVREHVMCAASNGIALHGGLRPFASTFFIFTDYARPAIRLAALMGLPVIYVLTHDSIGVGEDGPTHQPVEHLASFRAMPNMTLIRPADASEVTYAWVAALQRREGPTMLILTRQKLPVLCAQEAGQAAVARGVLKGAYIVSAEQGTKADVIIIASGSEVHVAIEAAQSLRDSEGIDSRVVSMPSWELFRDQPVAYRNEVLPSAITARISIETGASTGWCEWVGENGIVLGLDRFGASAPGGELLRQLGFSRENLAARVREQLRRA